MQAVKWELGGKGYTIGPWIGGGVSKQNDSCMDTCMYAALVAHVSVSHLALHKPNKSPSFKYSYLKLMLQSVATPPQCLRTVVCVGSHGHTTHGLWYA